MQVEAIYEHGSLKLLQPLRLKKGRERLTVSVPDDALEEGLEAVDQSQAPALTEAQKERAEAMLARLDAIRAVALADGDQDDELTEKQRERMEAFALRAQYRREQGRPV